jgi:hypothetical protein
MSLLGRVGRSLRSYWPPRSLPRDSSRPARVHDVRPQNCPLAWGSWAAYHRVHLVTEHSTLLYWNLPLHSASLLCTWLCTYVSPTPRLPGFPWVLGRVSCWISAFVHLGILDECHGYTCILTEVSQHIAWASVLHSMNKVLNMKTKDFQFYRHSTLSVEVIWPQPYAWDVCRVISRRRIVKDVKL